MRFVCLLLLLLVGCHKKETTQPPEPHNTDTDNIYGADVDPADSYYVKRNQIFYKGNILHLKGINWFGLENYDTRLHGLWTGRSIESFVDQIKELGFNAIRVPVVHETFLPLPGSDGFATPLAQLEHLINYTRQKGMFVLLDLHKCSKEDTAVNKPGPGRGVCSTYTEAKWIDDLQILASLALKNSNVLGIDLFNEPYGFSWSDWLTLVEHGAEAVLRINPKILIFVEGVHSESPNGGFNTFWGENLYEADVKIPAIPRSRLVYSPHIYGPSVYNQEYFDAPDFPKNMPAVWDAHFGKLEEDFSLVVGEFGGRYIGKDKVLLDALVDYYLSKGIKNTFFWALNPNSGDTGGLLKEDWRTVDDGKLALIQRL